MDLQRRQLLNHNGNYPGQIAEHPALRLRLRAPMLCNTWGHRDGAELVSLHRACSWHIRIVCHKKCEEQDKAVCLADSVLAFSGRIKGWECAC